MKKSLLLIAVSIFIGVSCTKQDDPMKIVKNPESTSTQREFEKDQIEFNDVTYQIADGMLTFTSFDEYENLFEVKDPNSLTEFGSAVEESEAMTSYNENLDEVEKMGFIGSIVNGDGIFKVDAYLILLDFHGKMVFATDKGTIEDLLNAKKGDVSKDVLQFDMENRDVIEELRDHGSRGIFCNASWAPSDNQWSNLITTTVKDNNNVFAQIQTNVNYGKYGVYFEMKTESYSGNWASLSGITVPRNLNYNYSWERRCGTTGSGNYTTNCTQTWSAVCNRCVTLIYGNVRALKHYCLTSTLTSNKSNPVGASVSASICH